MKKAIQFTCVGAKKQVKKLEDFKKIDPLHYTSFWVPDIKVLFDDMGLFNFKVAEAFGAEMIYQILRKYYPELFNEEKIRRRIIKETVKEVKERIEKRNESLVPKS